MKDPKLRARDLFGGSAEIMDGKSAMKIIFTFILMENNSPQLLGTTVNQEFYIRFVPRNSKVVR